LIFFHLLYLCSVKITIYHNPKCSKSRCALQWLKERFDAVEIVDYIKNPVSADELRSLAQKLGASPHEWVRKEEEAYKIHVLGKGKTDEELFQLMHQFPKLIQRPIVVWSDRAIVARPLEPLMEALRNAN